MKYKNYYSSPKYSEVEKTYYGSIYNIPEASMIEANTLEEFERIFHQHVDDYLNKKEEIKANIRSKKIIILVCIIALFGVAVLTCPDRQSHNDAIINMVNEVIKEQSNTTEEDAEWAVLGMSIAQSVSDWVLEGGLTVNNHFFFSVGYFTQEQRRR